MEATRGWKEFFSLKKIDCDDLKRFIMDELHKRPYIGHPRYQKMITATRK